MPVRQAHTKACLPCAFPVLPDSRSGAGDAEELTKAASGSTLAQPAAPWLHLRAVTTGGAKKAKYPKTCVHIFICFLHIYKINLLNSEFYIRNPGSTQADVRYTLSLPRRFWSLISFVAVFYFFLSQQGLHVLCVHAEHFYFIIFCCFIETNSNDLLENNNCVTILWHINKSQLCFSCCLFFLY